MKRLVAILAVALVFVACNRGRGENTTPQPFNGGTEEEVCTFLWCMNIGRARMEEPPIWPVIETGDWERRCERYRPPSPLPEGL